MSYATDYEPSDGYLMARLLLFAQPFLKGQSELSEATFPTLLQAEALLDEYTAEVASALVRSGYSATQAVATVGTNVSRLLSAAIVYGAVRDLALSRPIGLSPEGRNPQAETYAARYNAAMKVISGIELERLGATRSINASDTLKTTGRTWTEEDDIAKDADEKGAMFPRGYRAPGARRTSLVEITDPAND